MTEWVPGTVHPTGGYDEIDDQPRKTIVVAGTEAELQGRTIYRLTGVRHRVDGPAVIKENGDEEWWLYGVRHREDGPARSTADGSTTWISHGKIHRVDGPAQEWSGRVMTWRRADGSWKSGVGQWWIEGVECDREVHAQIAALLVEGAPLDWAVAFANGETV